MIRSFRDKSTEKLFNRERVRRFESFAERAREDLTILDATSCLDDLRAVPGYNLEALKGDRKGQYSIRINKKVRIRFVWKNGEVHYVEVVPDYH